MLIGYSEQQNGWLVYDPYASKVTVTRDVRFEEQHFTVSRSAHTLWLDSLDTSDCKDSSDSDNYQDINDESDTEDICIDYDESVPDTFSGRDTNSCTQAATMPANAGDGGMVHSSSAEDQQLNNNVTTGNDGGSDTSAGSHGGSSNASDDSSSVEQPELDDSATELNNDAASVQQVPVSVSLSPPSAPATVQ